MRTSSGFGFGEGHDFSRAAERHEMLRLQPLGCACDSIWDVQRSLSSREAKPQRLKPQWMANLAARLNVVPFPRQSYKRNSTDSVVSTAVGSPRTR